MSRSNLQH